MTKIFFIRKPTSKKIINAFKKINREDFVDPKFKDIVSWDEPIPIGYEQTNSQPTTVAIMLELLELKEGLKVLDVGSGSGWTSALLAYMVGENGHVIGVDVIPELVRKSRENVGKYFKNNVEIFLSGDDLGYPPKAPYDRILVSAYAEDIPLELIKQLKVGGIMVIPIRNSIFKVIKKSENPEDYIKEEYPGFVFVPLIK